MEGIVNPSKPLILVPL